MKNLKKVAIITVVLLIALTAKTFAMSQEAFIEYVSKPYTINGSVFQITVANENQLRNYLKDNPITDAEADKMKEIFDGIVAFVESTGAKDINSMTKEQKQELFKRGQEMAAVVGITLTYNNTDKTIEFYKDGRKITAISIYAILGRSSLVQTGNSNYGYLIVPVAIAVLAIGGVILFKKANK